MNDSGAWRRSAVVDGGKIYIGSVQCTRLSRILVEIAGLEPAASGLQSRRSPS
jgi:hypothetical protein